MESFLDDVDGCVLTIKELHSAISFPTPSDALFASVILKYANVTMELFDDLFTIFRLAEFRSDNLKMGQTHDILGHIAEQRQSIIRARGVERDQTAVQSRSQACVPLLAVDLVAEHLDNERIPFQSLLMQLNPTCEAHVLLREMSLVHRSWTDAAQRCLRRRICCSGLSGMGLLLQSPHLGPWVRDLSIVSHFYLPAIDQPDTNYRDTPKLLKTILKRCPNVINLHLQDFQPRTIPTSWPSLLRTPVIGTPHNIVPALGDLILLENLWLHQIHDAPAASLPELCAVLPRLRSLKSLSLRNWTERDTMESDKHEQPSMNVSGSNGMEAMSLTGIKNTSSLSRLTIALQDHAPSVLELSFFDMRFPPGLGPETGLLTKGLQPFVEPVKPFITKLKLSEYQTEDDVTSVLKQFPSLQVLMLCMTYFSGLPPVPFLLPASTRFVHIHYRMVPTEAQDPFAIAMLEASPHIRNLSVSFNSLPGHNVELVFTDTKTRCEENNVHFELKEVEEQPSFLDLRSNKYQ